MNGTQMNAAKRRLKKLLVGNKRLKSPIEVGLVLALTMMCHESLPFLR
jgi:hypothetical protein